MTDKQIIIDGVDVADCEHINTCAQKIKCVILQDDVCEINPYCEGFNCYYKQLKRKEQECKELTSKYSQLEEVPRKIRNIILKFAKQDILTFPDLKPKDNYAIIQNQCLEPIKQIIKFLDEVEDDKSNN